MVAITVVLAAVIGAFVLGFSGELGDSAPQARFNFDFDTGSDTVTITHEGGDKIDGSNINVTGPTSSTGWGGDSITAGSSQSFDYDALGASSGQEIRVVWSSPNAGESATIARTEVP